MYRASAQLLIERTPPHVVNFTDVLPSEENAAMAALTQRLIFLHLTLHPDVEARVRRVYRDMFREEHYLTQQAILRSGSLAQEAVNTSCASTNQDGGRNTLRGTLDFKRLTGNVSGPCSAD